MDRDEFTTFLTDVLIPDLRESGSDATAQEHAQRGSKNAASVSARLGASTVHRPG